MTSVAALFFGLDVVSWPEIWVGCDVVARDLGRMRCCGPRFGPDAVLWPEICGFRMWSGRSGASIAAFGRGLGGLGRPSRLSDLLWAIWGVRRGLLSCSERSGASIAAFGRGLSGLGRPSRPSELL